MYNVGRGIIKRTELNLAVANISEAVFVELSVASRNQYRNENVVYSWWTGGLLYKRASILLVTHTHYMDVVLIDFRVKYCF